MTDIQSTTLAASAKIGDGAIAVGRIGTTDEGRQQYAYVICDGEIFAFGTDMHTGVNLDPGPVPMLGTLASFLSAAAESGPDGENGDLFSAEVVEWAQQNSDELAMLSLEIEEA